MGKNRRTMLSSCPQMALAEAIFEHLMGVTYCSFAWRVFIVTAVLKGREKYGEGGQFSQGLRA